MDAAGNPVLSYQLAGAVEAMQPLMNMITFSARSRERIIALHSAITDAIEAHDAAKADGLLADLALYTQELAHNVISDREAARAQG